MSEDSRYTIVIAGGGTAGWMTAAALAHALPARRYCIRLVESPAIGTVGVGEATIPGIVDFNAAIGIDENAMLKATGGSFKLGIEFTDWGTIGSTYIHPFGPYGFDLYGTPFHQHWLRRRAAGGEERLESYSMSASAARLERFTRPFADPDSPVSHLRYAYHFDATLYADFLRKHACQKGVEHLQGEIVNVHRQAETGDITTLALRDGRSLAGDLFVDCTGFRARLIDQAMGVGYQDWSHWLPCDRAVAVPTEPGANFRPYTRATAGTSGWQWRIPLQHRTGNGHVYCSSFLSDDDAVDQLLAGLETPTTADPRLLRFDTGARQQSWAGNCVAIGLSAGFLEPLESTGIHLIQEGVSRLIALMPDGPINARERQQYNALMADTYANVRDFVILHYFLSRRDDSPFWRQVAAMEIPDSLRASVELFLHRGRFFDVDRNPFKTANWLSVMIGQGSVPQGYDPLADAIDSDACDRTMADMRRAYADAAQRMPPHRAFVDRFCAMQR